MVLLHWIVAKFLELKAEISSILQQILIFAEWTVGNFDWKINIPVRVLSCNLQGSQTAGENNVVKLIDEFMCSYFHLLRRWSRIPFRITGTCPIINQTQSSARNLPNLKFQFSTDENNASHNFTYFAGTRFSWSETNLSWSWAAIAKKR